MSDEKELRDFLYQDIYRRIDHYNETWGIHNDVINRVRNWCITLYMAAIGFCLLNTENRNLIFYALSLIPVIWFWFYTAYHRYFADIYFNHEDYKKMKNILYNLHSLSHEEQIKTVDEIQNLQFDWPKKGEWDRSRFFREKIPGIYKNAKHLEYMLFYGVMILLWILLIILILLTSKPLTCKIA
jgi:hypothetical protein